MIKINLLAERKQPKTASQSALKPEGLGGGQNFLLLGVLLIGVAIAGGWWYMLNSDIARLNAEHVEADKELERLTEIRAKGEEYERRKELLSRKIQLITDLKKQQAVPVHILDKVSKGLPDYLWLEGMSSANNRISINGKATTYNAVSNFYANLTESGCFQDVTLGRTFEVAEGVAFSLTCNFVCVGEVDTTDTQPS